MKTKGELRGEAFWMLCSVVGFLAVTLVGGFGGTMALIDICQALKPTFSAVHTEAIVVLCVLGVGIGIYFMCLSMAKETAYWEAKRDEREALASRPTPARPIRKPRQPRTPQA